MARSVQGPCEVLPASKFKEEGERRSQLGIEANEGLRAIFLCKYVYSFNNLACVKHMMNWIN